MARGGQQHRHDDARLQGEGDRTAVDHHVGPDVVGDGLGVLGRFADGPLAVLVSEVARPEAHDRVLADDVDYELGPLDAWAFDVGLLESKIDVARWVGAASAGDGLSSEATCNPTAASTITPDHADEPHQELAPIRRVEPAQQR